MFSKWLQNDLGLSWNLILFHLIPNEPCIPNYSSIGHLVLHGLQMASVWDETWYSSISTQMHPAYQISDHLDHWYRFWNLGNICIGRKTSHAHPPFNLRIIPNHTPTFRETGIKSSPYNYPTSLEFQLSKDQH